MEPLEEIDLDFMLQLTLWMEDDEWLLPLPAIEANGESREDSGSDGSQATDATSCVSPMGSAVEADKPCARSPTQRRRSSINPSRERRKRELIALRAEAKELTEQLEMIQCQRETRVVQRSNILSGRTQPSGSMWEAVARRQFHACTKAELVNAKLKSKIADHARLISDILRRLHEAQQDPETQALLTEVVPVDRVPDHFRQSLSEEEHEQQVDSLMDQWETIFCANEKFKTMGREFREARIVSSLDTAVVLEVVASVSLPFGVDRVDETMWKLHQRMVNEDDDVVVIQEDFSTNDKIVGGFTSMVRLQNMRGLMNGKFVTKRYTLIPSQRLLVTLTYSEPKGFSNDFNGIEVSDNMWVRLVDPFELDQSSQQRPLTVIQYVVRTRVCLDARHQTPRSAIEEKTTVFLNHMQRELEWTQGCLEKQLMQLHMDQHAEA